MLWGSLLICQLLRCVGLLKTPSPRLLLSNVYLTDDFRSHTPAFTTKVGHWLSSHQASRVSYSFDDVNNAVIDPDG